MTSLVRRSQALPARVVKPRRSPQWLLNQLPVGMLDGDFFVRFVSIFQELGGTLLEDADNIEYLARRLGRARCDGAVARRPGSAPRSSTRPWMIRCSGASWPAPRRR